MNLPPPTSHFVAYSSNSLIQDLAVPSAGFIVFMIIVTILFSIVFFAACIMLVFKLLAMTNRVENIDNNLQLLVNRQDYMRHRDNSAQNPGSDDLLEKEKRE